MNKQANLPPQVIYQSYPEADDEIDVSELFNKIWLRRKFILIWVFIAVVVSTGIMAATMLVDPPQRRYSEILQFNFPNAEKGLYPAGQQFSYNDIVSAKVLSEVYHRNKLDEHGVDMDDFIDAIAINPYAENAEFIKKKYQGLLANKKLTRPEIESLEKAYLDEISAAQSRFARLSLIETSLGGLDELLVQKVLTDIPRVWSRVSIEELGVLDLKVAGADFYQGGLVKRFEYLQTLEYLKESAKYLSSALEILIGDEIGGLVRNPKSGKSGYDIQVQLNNLVSFEVEPLFSTVTNLGITRDANKALIYLRNTIQNFEDKKEVLERKALNYEQIINQYSGGTLDSKSASQAGANGGFAQFDATFLDKFTALIEDKNDQAFKQELLKQRLEVLQDIEDIKGSIIKFQRAEKRLVASADNTPEDVRQDVIEDIGMARQNFETLVEEYKELLAARNQQVLGNTASLYSITSNDLLTDSDLISRAKKLLLFAILAGFVALMLATLVALFKKLPETPQQATETTE